MRIASLLLLCLLFYLCVGSGKKYWRKRVKKLESKLRRLESRVEQLEKGICTRSDCPEGFVQVKKYCLRFVIGLHSKKNWSQSRRECQKLGADLVTIESRIKEKVIARHLDEYYVVDNSEIFTGLIVTDETIAKTPYQFKGSIKTDRSSIPMSIRWVSTNHAITTDTTLSNNQHLPFAKWSPRTIHGMALGPNLGQHSCITVGRESSSNSKLRWTFNCCEEVSMDYICESKRNKSTCG